MSSSIESRVVTMKFDNEAFKRGAETTLQVLSKLTAATAALPGIAGKGLGAITGAAGKVNLAAVGGQADGVAHRFTAMQAVAVTALATIAHKATEAGLGLANSLTLGPISAGLEEYETNLNSIQTILANTGLEGQKGLDRVNGALDELNTYSDQTIYNFSEMARNIGTFTAAGVDLDTSTNAIKGIANLAAVSGSNSQQASTAMYQLSQALAAGKVSLMDWNSVVNAGMGGKVFQESLMETARVHGVAVDEMVKDAGSFRGSLEKGWLSSEILTETLSKFTGDLSEAQLRQMGYTEEQIAGIIKMGKTASDAATKVKTMSQLINTLQEAATSGWAKTWQLIFGDFNEAKKLWTGANEVLGGMIQRSAERRNKILTQWNKLGGRDELFQGIANAFNALLGVLKPVGAAFREVFAPMTGKGLYDMTVGFQEFTKALIPSKDTMRDIQTIFEAVFGVIGLGLDILGGFVGRILNIVGIVAGGSGSLLDFAAAIAEVVNGFLEWLRQGDYIANFFEKVMAFDTAWVTVVVNAFSKLLEYMSEIVSIGVWEGLEIMRDVLAEIEPYLPVIRDALVEAGKAVQDYLVDGFERLKPVLADVKTAVGDAFGALSGIGGKVGGAVSGFAGMFDLGDAADKTEAGIDKVNSALTGSGSVVDKTADKWGEFKAFLVDIGQMLKGFGARVGDALSGLGGAISGALAGIGDGAGGAASGIGAVLGGLWDGIKDFFKNIDASDIIVAVSSVLTTALSASFIRVLWNLGGALSGFKDIGKSAAGVLQQASDNLATMQKDVRANIILKIAVALLLLVGALFLLSQLDLKDIGIGLATIAIMLKMLSMSLNAIVENLPGGQDIRDTLQLAAVSLIILALAAAVVGLAVAVKIFSTMSPAELAKGLIAVAITLGALSLAAKAFTTGGKQLLAAAIAIGILAFALTALAAAIKLYSMLDTGMLVEGGAKIVAVIVGLGLAFRAFPVKGALGAAAAMFIIANALVIMAGALKLLATMDAGDSWQSLITLGVALGILAAAALVMGMAKTGAGALFVMAAGLAILVPQIVILGSLPFENILKGLGALAGIFIVLGVAGVVLAPIVPVIIGLGAGMLLLGVAMMAAGAGMVLFGVGLTAVSTTGAAAGAVLIGVVNRFLDALPGMINKFGKSLSAAAGVIRRTGPQFVQAGGAIISSFLKMVIKQIPLFARMLTAMIKAGLKVLWAVTPDFIKTGFRILMAFLQGLKSNMEKITAQAVQIVIKLMDGIGKNADKLIAAGKRLIGKLITAVGSEIKSAGGKIIGVMAGLGGDLISGLVRGLDAARSRVMGVVSSIISNIPGPIRKIMGIASPSKVMAVIGGQIGDGLVVGLDKSVPAVGRSAENMATNALDTVTVTMSKMGDALAVDPNFNPVITPVLDLSLMANDASKIGNLLAMDDVVARGSYSQAAQIANDLADLLAEGGFDGGGGDTYLFEQNNYSPEALDDVKIYRSSKNLMSQAKKELTP